MEIPALNSTWVNTPEKPGTARDMAKFGQLFLNRGEWNEEQIISSGWCDISTTAFLNPNNFTAEFPWADGHGYHWWQKTFIRPAGNHAAHFAFGWGGQMIMIIPGLNLVIVTTAGNWS
jgi:CubicO group peptidase (beta-lactamase class C family)